MFDTQTLHNIFDMAYSMPMAGVIAMLWFTLAFEVPRYAMTYIPALILIWRGRSAPKSPLPNVGRVSVLVAGHNEADARADLP